MAGDVKSLTRIGAAHRRLLAQHEAAKQRWCLGRCSERLDKVRRVRLPMPCRSTRMIRRFHNHIRTSAKVTCRDHLSAFATKEMANTPNCLRTMFVLAGGRAEAVRKKARSLSASRLCPARGGVTHSVVSWDMAAYTWQLWYNARAPVSAGVPLFTRADGGGQILAEIDGHGND